MPLEKRVWARDHLHQARLAYSNVPDGVPQRILITRMSTQQDPKEDIMSVDMEFIREIYLELVATK